MNNNIIRFGVSIEKDLLKKFDDYIKSKNYENRSEAIRDLIRENFVKEDWIDTDANKLVAGAIIIVYDHHKRELVHNLISIQHDYQDIIITTQHIHLDYHNCMEIIVVKGLFKRLEELQSKLKSEKGVKHSTIAKSTLGEQI